MRDQTTVLNNFLAHFDHRTPTGGQFLVKCPAHRDDRASLAVKAGDRGLVLTCHAGCNTSAICSVMGIPMSALFYADQPSKRRVGTGGLGREVEAYDYNDEHGCLLYQNVRYDPKDFRVRRPNGSNGWIYKLDDVRRVVYRLNELQGREAIVIAEGEKDCNRLWSVGIPATCNVGGASKSTERSKWLDEYTEQLVKAGVRRVRVIPDNDEAGRAHADHIVRKLGAAHVDARLVMLPASVKDVSEYLGSHTVGHLVDLLKNQTEPASASASPLPVTTTAAQRDDDHPNDGESGPRLVEILDDAPAEISRPLAIVGAHSYATTWLHLSNGEEKLAVIRDDGIVFCEVPLVGGSRPLTELGVAVHLPQSVSVDSRWSGKGVKHFIDGHRPDPARVFRSLVAVIDHHVRFERSLGAHDRMCELVAAYVLHTYLLDGLNAAGYIWYQGERGSGKSYVTKATCYLGYLGEVVLAGSSVPTLRDLSDYGAILGLDDAENVTKPDFDDDKRALFLSGNQRGASIAVKEPAGRKGTWVTRRVNIFSPRVFNSIRTPDATMASRCIQIPMCRTLVNLPDPSEFDQWPVPRRALIDDLWAVGLAHLTEIRALGPELLRHTSLFGRSLQPWRGVLTVALWLTQRGVDGLFDRMTQLSVAYQREREDLESDDPVRLAIACLAEMLDEVPGGGDLVFMTSALTKRVNELAKRHDLAEDGKDFTNVYKIGRMLGRLRFPRPANMPGPRRWRMTKSFLHALALAHTVTLPEALPIQRMAPTGTSDEF